MGRFYRTASAAPIDYMYKLNAPLMEKALMANDQFITQQRDEAAQVGTLADSYKYLAGDTEDAQAIIGGYKKRVADIANAIQADPANWRKQTNPINSLRQDFIDDYKTGAISKQIANYETRKQWVDDVDKQVELYNKSGGKDKSGNAIGISPWRAAKYKQYADANFTKTGYDKNNPTAYNVYHPEMIMGDIDIKKRVSEGLEKLKDDGEIKVETTLTGGERYFKKTTKGWEGTTKNKVLGLVMDNFAGDQGLQQLLKADTKVGAISGIYYPNDVVDPLTGTITHRQGDFIPPFTDVERNITPSQQAEIDRLQNTINKIKNPAVKAEQQQILKDHTDQLKAETDLKWNPESGLAPIFRGLVNQYSHGKTKDETEYKNNSWANTVYTQGQENARHRETLDLNREKEKNVNDRFAKELDYKYYALTQKGKGTDKDKKATDKKAETDLPAETAVSIFSTRNTQDWQTPDENGKYHPVLSIEGLSSDIRGFKNKIYDNNAAISKLDAQINNPLSAVPVDLLKRQKEVLVRENAETNNQLNLRRGWLTSTNNAVLTNHPEAGSPLSKEDIDLYKEFENDRSGEKYKKEIENLRKQYPDVPIPVNKNTGGLPFGSANTDQNYLPSKEVQAAKTKLAKYYDAVNRVNKNQNTLLTSIRNKNVVNSDAIIPTAQESQEVANMLLSNHAGAEIFDSNGNKGSNISLKGKNILGFEVENDYQSGGGTKLTFNNDELVKYMNANDVKMVVTKIGTSTGIGNGGAVMEVNFNDPTGKLSNQNFYVTVPPELTADVARKYSKHRNPAVATIASNLADPEAMDLRNQFNTPKFNNILGNGQTEQSFDIYVKTRSGNIAALNVTKLPDTNDLSIRRIDKDGKLVPYERSQKQQAMGVKSAPGIFHGSQDAIENILQITRYE